MLPLYLLAAHLVGDFVFQTRWQADGKFGWELDALALRSRHVLAYATAFLPVVVWRCWSGPPWWHGAGFFAWLIFLHWLTDSRRFPSTIGDFVGWRFASQDARRDEWLRRDLATPRAVRGSTMDSLPPNPWPTLPLAIDQTLHVVQVAILAGLFL